MAFDELAQVPRQVGVVEGHALAQGLDKQVARERVFVGADLVENGVRRGQLNPRGQQVRPVARHVARRDEEKRLFAIPGQVGRQSQEDFLSVRGVQRVARRIVGCGQNGLVETFVAALSAVGVAVGEGGRGGVEDPFAQGDGPLAPHEGLAPEPVGQAAGVVPQNGGEKNQLGRVGRADDLGQDQVHRVAPARFAERLNLVGDNGADAREHLGPGHEKGFHLFVNSDKEIVPSLEDLAVRVGPLARGDGRAVTQRGAYAREGAELLLRQRLGGDQIDHAAAPVQVTHRGHLGHKGLARGRGRRNQQVAVMQKPVLAQRLFLQRQQALDPLPPPRLEGFGREAERGQMFDRERHDGSPPG